MKIPLSFGLREKFTLLVLMTGVAIAFGLPWLLKERASAVVVQHELADLQDEAELRCWEIIDLVGQLRRTVHQFTPIVPTPPKSGAPKDPTFDDLVAELQPFQKNPAPSLEAANLTGWKPYVLAIDTFDKDNNVTRLYRAPGLGALPEAIPASPATLIRTELNAKYVRISPLKPLRVPEGFVPILAPDKDRKASGVMMNIPTVWCVSDYLKDHKNGGIAICVSLYRAQSSRHLQFLTDAKEYLFHPDVTPDGQGKGLYLSDSEDSEDGPTLDLLKSAREETHWVMPGVVPVEANQTQRRYGPTENARLVQPAYFREGNVPRDAWTKISRDAHFQAWKDDLRYRAERTGVQMSIEDSGTVRLRSRDLTRLNETQGRIVDVAFQQRAGTPQTPIEWPRTPVTLLHADYQKMRFTLSSPQMDETDTKAPNERWVGPTYYLIYGAFREELASAIGAEFQQLMLLGLFAAGLAALLASSAAWYFVRPLQTIATAAREVTVSDSSGETLQRQVHSVQGQVRQHLRRRGEVGDIASALDKLLGEVIKGHSSLLQAKSDVDKKVEDQTRLLTEKARQLERLDEAKDFLIRQISHNLRSPLTVIKGWVDIVLTTNLDADQRKQLTIVAESTQHLHQLISLILDYQKLKENKFKLTEREIPTPKYFQTIRDSLSVTADKSGNRLVFEGTENLGAIRNDPLALRQVLENLIGNAMKFTKAGTIQLSASRETMPTGVDWLTLSVADDGPGIAPEILPELFKPFNSLAPEKGNKDGTGLGLATSRKLVELMGGTLNLATGSLKGAKFVIQIPANIGEQSANPLSANKSTTAVDGSGLPLVLVVDDDPAVLGLMNRHLRPKGYEVIGASDAESGIRIARDRRPAVIILDIVLPDGKSGWDVMTNLKSARETAEIPVIMLSFLEDDGLGAKLGAVDYVTKPIAWDTLVASLRRITGFSPAKSSPVLIVDDDPDVRDVFMRTLTAEGLTVVGAANGAEALQKLREIIPSVILLDLRMPVVDGYHFIAEFEKNPKWLGIPIIVVTGSPLTVEEHDQLAGSVTAIVRKDERVREEIVVNVLGALNERTLKRKSAPTRR